MGHTAVLGSNMVNALRVAFNRTAVHRFNDDFFTPSDLGAKLYNNSPIRETQLAVTGGFNISRAQATKATADNNAFQVSNELTLVRGGHQLGFGANLAYWTVEMWAYSRGNGAVHVQRPEHRPGAGGLSAGTAQSFVQGSKIGLTFNHWYQGLYAQDAWRATERITVNAGLRWEPYSGQQIEEGSVAHFSLDRFRQGVKSTQFVNAPAGFTYPGDPGYPTASPASRCSGGIWRRGSVSRGMCLATAARPCGPPTASPMTFRQGKRGSMRPPARRIATASA